jgi:hypothetical protein
VRLYSPGFEKALKRSVKQAVRDEPELRKEFRRSKKSVRTRRGPRVARLIVSLVPAGLVWAVMHATQHVDSALMVINLWVLTTIPFLSQRLSHLPFRSRDILALRLLPVAETTIFRWELDKFFKESLFSLVDLVVGLGTLGLTVHLSPIRWGGLLVLVALNWIFMLTLAALGASRLPQLPYALIFNNLRMLWFVALAAHAFVGNALLSFINHLAPTFNWLVPTGWPLLLVLLLLPSGAWPLAILIFPIGLILWTFKSSTRLLREKFHYREPVMVQAPDLVPGQDAAESFVANGSDPSVRRSIGVTAIEEGILSGQFLSQEEWNQGWPEKILWRWFSNREKALAEFAFPKGLAITRPWKRITQHFLITLLLGFVSSVLSSTLELWIFGIGLFIVFAQTMAQVLGTGAAFRVILNNGIGIPIYAAYPVSFRGLSRMLLKCSIVQMPFFILLTTITTAALIHFMDQTLERGILMGIKAGFVFLGARFMMLVFAFSSGTSDTSRFRFRTFLLISIFTFFGVSFLILAAAAVFVQFELASWLCCAGSLVVAYLFFRIYGWFYNANRFDLMRQPR